MEVLAVLGTAWELYRIGIIWVYLKIRMFIVGGGEGRIRVLKVSEIWKDMLRFGNDD